MATHDHIRNPVEWSVDQVRAAGAAVGHTTHAVLGPSLAREDDVPEVRRIELSDLRTVLERGWADFMACRSDVIFIAIVYPLAGIVLAWSAFNYNFVPLLFPLISGFALLGPVAAVGLYEMSRRRELGAAVGWGDALGVVATPAFVATEDPDAGFAARGRGVCRTNHSMGIAYANQIATSPTVGLGWMPSMPVTSADCTLPGLTTADRSAASPSMEFHQPASCAVWSAELKRPAATSTSTAPVNLKKRPRSMRTPPR